MKSFLDNALSGKMKPTVQVLEAFRGLLLGLCRTGILTDVKTSQHTRVAHSGGKPKSGLPGDNPQEQGITIAQFDKYLSFEPMRS